MIKEIVKDINVLSAVSRKATKKDLYIINDLIDTANEHIDRCVGLAAIQINEPVRIIIVHNGEKFMPFVNPIIIDKSIKHGYYAEEGCMSLDGTREVFRYDKIAIMHEVKTGKFSKEIYSGRMAQIIQHEIDHLNGKII